MNPRDQAGRLRKLQGNPTCPMCGATGPATSYNDYAFTYGTGESAVELTVTVPVRRCKTCDFDYLDEAAESIKHEAICQYLGVLPPTEIRRIRQNYRMTRARFAEITGLGEASLNRWENGLNIQSHANDRYLRLLADSHIMQQLQELLPFDFESPPQHGWIPVDRRFRTLKVTEALLKEKESFRLRTAA